MFGANEKKKVYDEREARSVIEEADEYFVALPIAKRLVDKFFIYF
jgi:hypothetical protein